MFLSRSKRRGEAHDTAQVLERLRRLRLRPGHERADDERADDERADDERADDERADDERAEESVTRLNQLPGESADAAGPSESTDPWDPTDPLDMVTVEPTDPTGPTDPPRVSADPAGSTAGPGPPLGSRFGLDLDRSRLRRGHVVVVAVALLIAVVGAGVVLLRHRPVEVPTGAPPVRAEVVASSTPSASPTGPADVLMVHVAGKVRHPGVVRLPSGARVVDAVRASGGMLHGVDPATINLAQPLSDGQQVLVGVTPPPGALLQSGAGTSVAGGAGTPAPAQPIDLNLATLEQLDELPGIGPVLGERILQARDERGGFTSVDELREVSGIGEKRYADLSSLVTVG